MKHKLTRIRRQATCPRRGARSCHGRAKGATSSALIGLQKPAQGTAGSDKVILIAGRDRRHVAEASMDVGGSSRRGAVRAFLRLEPVEQAPSHQEGVAEK
jgi:hypothetical protein